MNPKMQIVWQVLEAAKDCQDQTVIAACRRAIIADMLGHKCDMRLINTFVE